MASSEIKVGIVGGSSTVRDHLHTQIAAAVSEPGEGMGLFTTRSVAEVELVDGSSSGSSSDVLVQADPEVVLVHMEDVASTLDTLQYLSELLPNARLMVTSKTKKSEAVIATMQAGAREFLTEPVSPQDLAQALQRYVSEKRRTGSGGQIGKIYSVIAPKGGTGGTTVAINIATSLVSNQNGQVAIIDLDNSKGDVAGYMNLRPEYCVSNALAEVSRLDEVLLAS